MALPLDARCRNPKSAKHRRKDSLDERHLSVEGRGSQLGLERSRSLYHVELE